MEGGKEKGRRGEEIKEQRAERERLKSHYIISAFLLFKCNYFLIVGVSLFFFLFSLGLFFKVLEFHLFH